MLGVCGLGFRVGVKGSRVQGLPRPRFLTPFLGYLTFCLVKCRCPKNTGGVYRFPVSGSGSANSGLGVQRLIWNVVSMMCSGALLGFRVFRDVITGTS